MTLKMTMMAPGAPRTKNLAALARPLARLAVVVGMATALSGCGLSSLTSGLGSSVFKPDSEPVPASIDDVTEAQLLKAAKSQAANEASGAIQSAATPTTVSHGCPKVVVRTQDNHLTIYEEGRIGDSLAVRHRGEITKTARECTIEPGRVTVKYGFSGRVLLGPRGTSGNIAMPVMVAVADSSKASVANDQLEVATDVTVEKPIGYFSAVRTVTFALPEGTRAGDFSVYLSFRQPPKPAVAG
ncbi:MAG: hypothetical protein ACRBCJ_03120 [Hyphomicrobiaceae bacterium]